MPLWVHRPSRIDSVNVMEKRSSRSTTATAGLKTKKDKGKTAQGPQFQEGDLFTSFFDTLISLSDTGQEAEGDRSRAMSLMHHISDRSYRNAKKTAKFFGLHVTELYGLIFIVRYNPQCIMPVSQLQRALSLTAGGATRLLNRMEAENLATRVSDPTDGRAWLVQLTSKGKALARQIVESRRERVEAMHDSLSRSQWRALAELLQTLDKSTV